MEGSEADRGAIVESVVFLEHFRDLPDPRQRGKVIYPLEEVLLLCLLAVLAGAERPERIPCGSGAKSPPGTTISSQASSLHDLFTRFPWPAR